MIKALTLIIRFQREAAAHVTISEIMVAITGGSCPVVDQCVRFRGRRLERQWAMALKHMHAWKNNRNRTIVPQLHGSVYAPRIY